MYIFRLFVLVALLALSGCATVSTQVVELSPGQKYPPKSPAEVEQAVRWAKFWPRGERGLNGGNCDGRFGLTPLAEYTARSSAVWFESGTTDRSRSRSYG